MTQNQDMGAYLQRLLAYRAAGVWDALPFAEALSQRLMEAMQQATQYDHQPPLAPTLFVLRLPEAYADAFHHNRGLGDELAQALHEVGKRMGLAFPVIPNVRVDADPRLEANAFDVRAELVLPDTLRGVPWPRPDEEPPRGAYLLVGDGRVFPLRQGVVHIGRRSDNDLVLADPRVSRRHAQLRLRRGYYMLFDLGSTGGTYVNGKPITQTVLYPGDQIRFAGMLVTYGQRSTRPLTEAPQYAPDGADGRQDTLVLRRDGLYTAQTKGLSKEEDDEQEKGAQPRRRE